MSRQELAAAHRSGSVVSCNSSTHAACQPAKKTRSRLRGRGTVQRTRRKFTKHRCREILLACWKEAMVPTLSESDVAKHLRYEELILAMEKALAAFSAGRVIQPVRNMLTIEEGKRFLGIMPAVTDDAMGAKLVSFYPKNAGSPVPTHTAMIMLFEPQTGQPLAFMDGRLITEMRTAAVSAAVTKRLAPENSRVLALLGSGVQAHAHLQALRFVRDFREVRVWSRTPENAKRFAAQHAAQAMD